ncbi:calpain family cysteine protease containing protein [Stylonychia lemnae]|uniref:Calpain family cysteine protease containing protein n=1 Tax=Stylonychia lemnae TaxID=5949 RepID=A0A078B8X6_STYLE|nr:calpain family cysteine protease containing protein [Stylonychia lemnae]|eukprot:CDW90945.1 calpain family cysteine protease containing protein [Stylonychia lemnae]
MRLTLANALLLLGTISASQKNRIQKILQFLPQTQEVQQTCQSNINRSKQDLVDYKTIVQSSPDFWNDPMFPADSTSIQWSGEFSENQLTGRLNTNWQRLNNICPECTMYGKSDFLNDIDQNGLGDCYFLAGISSLAEVNSRFEKIFVNPKVNWAGLYAFNVYIRGIPQVIVVDDAVPTGSKYTKPIFAGLGLDGAMWGPLLEKAWAKANVNYERIEGGHGFQPLDFLSSAPHQGLSIKTTSKDAVWARVSDADSKNYIMSLGTPSSPGGDQDTCKYNIACGHAYSLLGVTVLANEDRSIEIKIFKIRNPWRKEGEFSGSFADGSTLWFTIGPDGKTWAEKVNLEITNDGVFYMTLDEVMETFSGIGVFEWREDFVTSWYDKRDDQISNKTTPSIYTFTLTESTPLQIRVLPYPKRMYPVSCRQGDADFKLTLLDSKRKKLNSISFDDSEFPYINLVDTPLAAGTYTLQLYAEWDDNDVRDYGVIINSPKDIAIKDIKGEISRPTSHDFNSKDLEPLVDQVPKPQLPDYSQIGSVYDLTGDLKADLSGIRYSQSLLIKKNEEGSLYGNKVVQVNKRWELIYFQGTTSKDYTFTGNVKITTKPGYTFEFTQGNDKCSITNNLTSGDDSVQCTCTITPEQYPKECMLAFLTKPYAGYKVSTWTDLD